MSTRATPKVIAEIRAEMARQAVTQTELAPKAHLSLQALRRRLSGQAPLLVDELLAIAAALKVPASALLPAAAAETETSAGCSNGRRSPTQPRSGERNGQ